MLLRMCVLLVTLLAVWHQTQLCYIAVSLCWHYAIRKLLLGCDAGVVGQLWPVSTTISCPNTTTQHMTYVDRMPHEMITCGMQVSTCDGCAVGKHGKGLWCGAGMCGHMCSPICAPKCTNLCPPPSVVPMWQNMCRTWMSSSAPPSQVPCPPFPTFTRRLHPHLSGRKPVKAKLTS